MFTDRSVKIVSSKSPLSHSSFDKLLDSMLDFPFFGEPRSYENVHSPASFPKVNVIRYDEKVEIIAALAGYSKDSINIEIEKNCLILSGQAIKEIDDSNASYVRKEIRGSKFTRTFNLGDQLNTSAIKATFENGLLTIAIPILLKSADSGRSKVEIV